MKESTHDKKAAQTTLFQKLLNILFGSNLANELPGRTREDFWRGTLKESTHLSQSQHLMTNSPCSGWGQAQQWFSPWKLLRDAEIPEPKRVNIKLHQVKNVGVIVWKFVMCDYNWKPRFIHVMKKIQEKGAILELRKWFTKPVSEKYKNNRNTSVLLLQV